MLSVAGMLVTSDKLQLDFGADGRLAVSLEGCRLAEGPALCVRDARSGQSRPLVGATVVSGNQAEFRGEAPELKLSVEVRYTAFPDRIEVAGKIVDTSKQERLVTVSGGMPIPRQKWQWGRDLTAEVEIPAEKGSQFTDKYPFAAIHDATNGLALAIALDKPRSYRLTANPGESSFSAEFDFALLPQNDFRGKSQSEADFYYTLYRIDPAWGFRSACRRYYDFYPQFFVDRIGKHGGFELCWDKGFAQETLPVLEQRHFNFYWGVPNIRDANATPVGGIPHAEVSQFLKARMTREAMLFCYIEPEFMQYSLSDMAKPTAADAERRLKLLSAGDADEWARFMNLKYTLFCCGQPHPGTGVGAIEPFLRKALVALDKSVVHNAAGAIDWSIQGRSWVGGYGAMLSQNLSPNLPGGKGRFAVEVQMTPLMKELEAQGLPISGYALDSFLYGVDNYRREHFQYAANPISFDRQNLKPVIKRPASSVEWLAYVHREQPRMRFMANIWGCLTFAAPYLDVFGREVADIPDPEFMRVLAKNRCITYLPYSPQSEANLDKHLFWDIYPGRGIPVEPMQKRIPMLDALYRAGWEPVTLARTGDPEIWIERYGQEYFTLWNRKKVPVTAKLRLELEAAGLEKVYPAPATSAVKDGAADLELAAGEVAVLRVKK